MNKHIYQISDAEIKAMECILNHGERVELIPCKESIKIIRISRNEVKPEKLNSNPDLKR